MMRFTLRQSDDSQPSTSSCSGSNFMAGNVVSGQTCSFAAASSGRSSSLPLRRSAPSVRPSTARLRYGRTSSSTISSRKTASGSNASFDRMTQSSNGLSLLMAISPDSQNCHF